MCYINKLLGSEIERSIFLDAGNEAGRFVCRFLDSVSYFLNLFPGWLPRLAPPTGYVHGTDL